MRKEERSGVQITYLSGVPINWYRKITAIEMKKIGDMRKLEGTSISFTSTKIMVRRTQIYRWERGHLDSDLSSRKGNYKH